MRINNGGVLQEIEGPTLKGMKFWEIVNDKKQRRKAKGERRERKKEEKKLKPIRGHERLKFSDEPCEKKGNKFRFFFVDIFSFCVLQTSIFCFWQLCSNP